MNVFKRILLYIIVGIGFGFTIINCGRDTVYTYQTPFQFNTPKDFQLYLHRFETQWGRSIGNVYIDYKDKIYDSREIIGLCEWFPGNPHIFIQTGYWSTANDAQKEQLLFHELAHCYLFRLHKDDVNTEVKQPMSIMHSDRQISEGFYWLNHDYYMNELFDR